MSKTQCFILARVELFPDLYYSMPVVTGVMFVFPISWDQASRNRNFGAKTHSKRTLEHHLAQAFKKSHIDLCTSSYMEQDQHSPSVMIFRSVQILMISCY